MIVIDPQRSRYKKGMLFGIKTLRMLRFHHITAFMKRYNVCKLQKVFLVRVFWLKHIFQIKFKIPILDLIVLPKISVPYEGLYCS